MTKCKILKVPEETCYISFGKGQTLYSDDGVEIITKGKKFILKGHRFETVRGEWLVIDYNSKGKIIGIELIGSEKLPKPCQKRRK